MPSLVPIGRQVSSFGPSRELVFLVLERIGQLLAISVVNVVVLRQLGPDTYGYLGAATAVLAIVLPMSNFGQVPVLRALSIERAHQNVSRGLVRYGVVLGFVGSLVGASCMLMSVFLFPPGITQSLIILLSAVFLGRPFWALDAWYKANGLNDRAAIIRLIGIFVGAIGRVIVVLTSESLIGLAVFIIIEHFVIGILFVIDYTACRPRVAREQISPESRKSLCLASIPMLASGFAVLIYMRIDQPMLLVLSGSGEVGLYSAAANLSDAVSFMPVVLAAMTSAAAFKIHADGNEAFSRYMLRLSGLATGIAYIVSAFGILLAGPLVRVLYGETYNESAFMLQILLLSAPFIFLGVVGNVWIAAEGLQVVQLFCTFSVAILNVILNWYLIPFYGAFGAAWVTVISHLFANLIANSVHPSTRPIFRRQMQAISPLFAGRMLFAFVWGRGSLRFLNE